MILIRRKISFPGGVTLPAGVTTLILPFATHRDPKVSLHTVTLKAYSYKPSRVIRKHRIRKICFLGMIITQFPIRYSEQWTHNFNKTQSCLKNASSRYSFIEECRLPFPCFQNAHLTLNSEGKSTPRKTNIGFDMSLWIFGISLSWNIWNQFKDCELHNTSSFRFS